jgi:twitching motility protein PilT
MDLEALVNLAATNGASDLHLESSLPAALRVRGSLKTTGDPIPPAAMLEMARGVIGEEEWHRFVEQRSYDCSRTYNGVRVRINILQTSRGVGFVIRLLSSFQATVDKLNLHPDLKKLTSSHNGLILVSGATGSGKSSTMAALIQEINATETRHIVTIESPIEYLFRPRRSYIRQREVGRDTPSFEQAIIDSLREDPDVLMVGEMRDSETMRLTLSASETGHLVLATVHSSTSTEALQRVVSAFPAEIQSGVAAQLADCLIAVIAQRLRFRPELNIRVPECEILIPNHAIKNFIRNREFFKITSSLETGAEHGMWTFQRYRAWLEAKKNWFVPGKSAEPDEADAMESTSAPAALPPPMPAASRPQAFPMGGKTAPASPGKPAGPVRIDIDPGESEFGKILKRPGE